MHPSIRNRRVSNRRNAEDADTGASGWSIAPTETNNGSSSSSTAPTEDRYDVFLSFRGPDTRYGFTDHLYHGLFGAGIRAFRDDNELRQGEEIGSDLLAAIKNSKILIPILSVNYGSSKWCLDELDEMMKCKNNDTRHIVLPIFYKVKPAHVRHQKGDFGNAFRTREKYFDQTTMEKWKQALIQVGDLKGWEAQGYEGKLVKSVVQKALSELKKAFELVLPENLVGIDNHVKKVMKFVDDNAYATLFVGIYGMGGIGKTTLAKTIYNSLSNQFEYRSFLGDVRELCKRNGIEYLQNRLISDILKQEKSVHNKDEGINFISSMFKGKKVLILLDDVGDDNQMKALVGNHNWFSSGSRIFITTRKKTILDKARVDYDYEHQEMDKHHSLILFSRHAFRRDSPPSEFKNIAHDVVSTTGGLPLSLEVLGSFLCGKQLPLWKDTFKKLKKVPLQEVRASLTISYEALDYGQKQIFLDIACFLIGTDRRTASYMWDACGLFPEEGIEVLRLMSLIKIGGNDELRMHDQLRDLGREIIREENQQEPQYRSRLWDFEEVLQVLKEKKGTKEIKAVYLSKGSSDDSGKTADQGGDIHINEQFKNLTNLRFLHVSGAHFSGDFKNSSEELRWLGLHNCPSTFGANNFHAKELAVLDLSRSKISDQWQGWNSIMLAKELKFLNLTCCESLEGTFFLSAFKNLEVLILENCREVKQIHSSIGDMKSLVCLNLTGCRSLKELPVEVGKLGSLKKLFLQHTGIKELPNSIGDLQNLEILNISFSEIEELPRGIGRLSKLRDLNASYCSRLRGDIPESILNLSSLQRLSIFCCRMLQSLPELPSSLKYLNITCQSSRLPSLSHLINLKELRLIDCTFLECIWELSECSQLTDVEESEFPKSLCTPLKLEALEIQSCMSMQTLEVSQLNHLRILIVISCTNTEVRGLEKLKYLESLTIRECHSIERLHLPKCEGLKILDISFCQNLVEIEGLNGLEFLENLNISGCHSIERFDLSKSKGLKVLIARYCSDIIGIQGFDKLEFLDISRCASIERLNLSRSEGMKILNAEYCENLVEIQGLMRLEELYISGCISLERLDLSTSKGMRNLRARNCENLVEIQGLNGLELLQQLNISGCVLLERLDLSTSKGMRILCAENCESLVEIQGLNGLELLKAVNIAGCSSLERLEFPKSENLMILDGENREEIHVNREGRCVNFRALFILILVGSYLINFLPAM